MMSSPFRISAFSTGNSLDGSDRVLRCRFVNRDLAESEFGGFAAGVGLVEDRASADRALAGEDLRPLLFADAGVASSKLGWRRKEWPGEGNLLFHNRTTPVRMICVTNVASEYTLLAQE